MVRPSYLFGRTNTRPTRATPAEGFASLLREKEAEKSPSFWQGSQIVRTRPSRLEPVACTAGDTSSGFRGEAGPTLFDTVHQAELIGGHKDVLMLEFYGEPQFASHLLQIRLK